MNSQIYCLPLKTGWNALTCISTASAENKKADELRRRQKAGTKPFFTVKFHGRPPSEETRELLRQRYPKFKDTPLSSDQEAVNAIYHSEYGFKFGPNFLAPHRRPVPPVSFEKLANPLLPRKKSDPPFSSFKPRSYGMYNKDRGAYEWRDLVPRPGEYLWQPLEKIPILGDAGERSTLPPVRVKKHYPTLEKSKWDSIRALVRNNALNYGFQTPVSGYTGNRISTESVFSIPERQLRRLNSAMVSTQHATHREIPLHGCQPALRQGLTRCLGADQRKVTLTTPHHPLAQPSACD